MNDEFMMTRRKWYTHDFLAESQKLLERAPTSKNAGLALPAEGLSNISKYLPWASPGYRLLRRHSLQPGPRWSRGDLRKQDSSYGPRGINSDRRCKVSVPANLPDRPVQPITLDMLYPMHFVHVH
ncbi:uncharacterized protein TNCV_2407351 [Trichonephila clavipes]|nr:uncharacterized protein TNCV_2407351 [Trichonephila clavipes]